MTMTRRFLLLLLLLPGAFRLSAKPLPKEYVRDSLPVLAERCRQLLETAYMADSLVGETDSLPGWEGLPVRLYEYRTGPDIRTGQPKKGKVYLLNPSPERLARWIATACWKALSMVSWTVWPGSGTVVIAVPTMTPSELRVMVSTPSLPRSSSS